MNLKFIGLSLTVILILYSCESKQSMVIKKETLNSSVSTGNAPLRIMGNWLGEGKKELLVRESVREFSLLYQNCDISLEFASTIFNNTSGN